MIFIHILLLVFPLLGFGVPAPSNRSPSTPFISGDTFRFFADHAYDELDTSLIPAQIQKGDTVFVKTDYLDDFFRKIHPSIMHPYILISHNSDKTAPGPHTQFLEDDKLLAWFAQNYNGYPHAKMHSIPIGIANSHWKHGDFHQILKLQKRKFFKKHLAYLNINVQTFTEERKKVAELFAKSSFCCQKTAQKYKAFLKDIASSQFVVSPRGNGLDTHRLWEALYMGSIPIVKSSSLDGLYKDLPILIVSDWEEITATFLKQKQKEWSQKKKNLEKLWIQYWLDQIQSYQRCRFESRKVYQMTKH